MDLDHDIDVIDFAAQEDCPWCEGWLEPMGRLGRLVWYRCRDCGEDSSAPA